MTLACVYSRARLGLEAPLVTVEVHLANGLPSFNIVGLPETSVKESKDRVRSALLNCGFEFPSRRLTINLAPADLPKEGGRYDLPIAIGILAASGQIPLDELEKYEFAGELALSGQLRSVLGEIPLAIATAQKKRTLFIPSSNIEQASLVDDAKLYGADHLMQVYFHLTRQQELSFSAPCEHESENTEYRTQQYVDPHGDLADVTGQPMAKRALEIAAAGGHNLLFLGPPGTGKTMLASRLPSILPQMTNQEALETAAIHSVSQQVNLANWRLRAFRSPHHTASAVALVGGGSQPKPGEISLAHNGVLFLDELAEYDRKVLDVLREPMESGVITISRANQKVTYPAQFQLVAAMNPSPTGFQTDKRSTPEQVLRYLNKLSGPFLDRIDIQMEVLRLPKGSWSKTDEQNETSAQVRARVETCRALQLNRQNKPNALLNTQDLKAYCQLSEADNEFLELAIEKLGMSTRAHHKILKIARSIADMAGEQDINNAHLTEALSYRAMDRLIRFLTDEVAV